MPDIISWLALGISSVLAIIEIVKLIKYWRKPCVELKVGFLIGKLVSKNGLKQAELRLPFEIINSGNQNVFIRNVEIQHLESHGNYSIKQIDTNFELKAKKSKKYDSNFSINYLPKEIKKFEGKWDKIIISVKYENKKIINEVIFFIMNEEKSSLSAFWGKDVPFRIKGNINIFDLDKISKK